MVILRSENLHFKLFFSIIFHYLCQCWWFWHEYFSFAINNMEDVSLSVHCFLITAAYPGSWGGGTLRRSISGHRKGSFTCSHQMKSHLLCRFLDWWQCIKALWGKLWACLYSERSVCVFTWSARWWNSFRAPERPLIEPEHKEHI